MAASLVLITNQDLTEKKSDDETSLMRIGTSWKPSPDTALTNIECELSFEDILIHLPQKDENEIPSSSHQTPQEMEQHSSCPVGSSLDVAGGEMFARQRRIGVVEAMDTVRSERMKARVLRKKFGEGLISEMPKIFNKKL